MPINIVTAIIPQLYSQENGLNCLEIIRWQATAMMINHQNHQYELPLCLHIWDANYRLFIIQMHGVIRALQYIGP